MNAQVEKLDATRALQMVSKARTLEDFLHAALVDDARLSERERAAREVERKAAVERRAERRLVARASGYVYFARAGFGPIKIGSSVCPEDRVKQLHWVQGDSVALLTQLPGGELRERQLHKLFARYRITGEWFQPCEPILNFIKQPFWMLPGSVVP
jgi:hypothetical protein